jgi:mRNA-degrading endonuclease RelE of RelBE toxin-antitoxin system
MRVLPGCVKLAGEPDLYRIRVGDYRIVYQVNDAAVKVLVLSIGHRRDLSRLNRLRGTSDLRSPTSDLRFS